MLRGNKLKKYKFLLCALLIALGSGSSVFALGDGGDGGEFPALAPIQRQGGQVGGQEEKEGQGRLLKRIVILEKLFFNEVQREDGMVNRVQTLERTVFGAEDRARRHAFPLKERIAALEREADEYQ
jgi:hypothetical protein